MSNRDYYEILGVDKNASKDDIKSAFRKKARQFFQLMPVASVNNRNIQ